ncbi:MAG TPA: hypothetical protein VMR74_00715 [Gammaproteobacteria bacterium]|nr:hypothetical protein [Gammaproteobacteria bacterium]
MPLDASELSEQMIGAGSAAFGEHWEEAKTFAEIEFRTIASRLETIAHQVARGLDPELARILFDSQKRTTIQAIAGTAALAILAVEAAVNSVLEVIRNAVNTALGFTLL